MKRITLAKYHCAFKLLPAESESFDEDFNFFFFLGYVATCGVKYNTKNLESIMLQSFFLYIISPSAALAAQISQEEGEIEYVPKASCTLHLGQGRE